MKAGESELPQFLLGIALLFWGWVTDFLVIGVVLGAVAEFGRHSPFKWELTDKHFYRLADLTSLLFAGVAIYQFNEYSIYAIYHILALVPVCIFPLLVAERYSTTGAIPMSALFLSLRRRVQSGTEKERFVTVTSPFVVVCVLASSTGTVDAYIYFACALVLIIGLMLGQRARRYKLSTWFVTITLVAGVAFLVQAGIRVGQQQLDSSFTYWFNQFTWFQTDPNRTRTAIGSIGRLKFSDKIRVRVFAPLSVPLPIVLHEASYSSFNLGTWAAKDGNFAVIDPEADSPTWIISPNSATGAQLTAKIVVTHPHDIEVTPLPYGTKKIYGSEVIEVQRSQYGTTLVEALPGQFEYGVSWTDQSAATSEPLPSDLSIPQNYNDVIDTISGEIGIDKNDPIGTVAKIRQFFSDNFKYTLIQRGFYPGRTPLSHFLTENRQGHCEYFATATTLLLRRAGIPARYAVGYVVDEYSSFEGAFVARARDAHSWAEAYVGGEWIMVDTTPAIWAALEHANASNWQVIQDMWSWLSNRYNRFGRTDRGSIGDHLVWFVPPLTLILVWRLRKQLRKVVKRDPENRIIKNLGSDSELYTLTTLLNEKGIQIEPGDTLLIFLRRNVVANVGGVSLQRIVELHYRYRFANQPLSVTERTELRDGCSKYCAFYRANLNDA
jgi:transglutaminase-like putative cysteine protease